MKIKQWIKYFSVEDISYLSVIVCFTAFLVNDLYAYYNWKRMEKKQRDLRGKS